MMMPAVGVDVVLRASRYYISLKDGRAIPVIPMIWKCYLSTSKFTPQY